MDILKADKLKKYYGSGDNVVKALDGVSITVEDGEFVSIVGTSGSGKSTLLHMLGGLDKPTSGSVIVDGKELSLMNDESLTVFRRRNIGFIFQNFELLPRQSAIDNVSLPLIYKGMPKNDRKDLASSALERVGLSDRVNFKPTQLSGGQKQRVAIARAMVNHPKILLADEPTGALDSTSGSQIMELFQKLNEEGISILMITHDQQIASYADRKIEIKDGVLSRKEGTVL